jgi:hypothetical protein
MTCKHKIYTEPTWRDSYICDWTGEFQSGYYEDDGGWKLTYVDTGLHTYKCTQCHEVFYYSQRAKEGKI